MTCQLPRLLRQSNLWHRLKPQTSLLSPRQAVCSTQDPNTSQCNVIYPVYDGSCAILDSMSRNTCVDGSTTSTPEFSRSLWRIAAQNPGQPNASSMLRTTIVSASRNTTAAGQPNREGAWQPEGRRWAPSSGNQHCAEQAASQASVTWRQLA